MSLQGAILNTLNYSAIFKYPLTKKELHRYLISPKKYTYLQVVNDLNTLVANKKVYTVANFYSTHKIDKVTLINKQKSIKQYKKVVTKVKKDLFIFNKLFFIKFVGLTGSVAAKDLKNDYDVDLFFICQKNLVWITRLFVVLYFKFKKIYKKPYCPNIYISNNVLTWTDQNVYIANEISRLKPLFNKNNTYSLFIKSNAWILKYMANFSLYKTELGEEKNKLDFLSYFFFPVDFILFFIEYLYMFPKISTEKISYSKILFFKKNYSKTILKKSKELS